MKTTQIKYFNYKNIWSWDSGTARYMSSQWRWPSDILVVPTILLVWLNLPTRFPIPWIGLRAYYCIVIYSDKDRHRSWFTRVVFNMCRCMQFTMGIKWLKVLLFFWELKLILECSKVCLMWALDDFRVQNIMLLLRYTGGSDILVVDLSPVGPHLILRSMEVAHMWQCLIYKHVSDRWSFFILYCQYHIGCDITIL